MAQLRTRFVVGGTVTVPPGAVSALSLLQFPFDASRGELEEVVVEAKPSNGAVRIEIVDGLVPITALVFDVRGGYSAPVAFRTGGVHLRQNADISARISNADAAQAVTVTVTILGWIVRGE